MDSVVHSWTRASSCDARPSSDRTTLLFVRLVLRYFAHDSNGNILSTNISFMLVACIIALAPVEPIYQGVFTVPAAAIETVMTCKVFRTMILNSWDDEDIADSDKTPNRNSAFLDTTIANMELTTRTKEAEGEVV